MRLQQQIAPFYLKQLALPENWQMVIRDTNLIQNAIRRKLAGEYTDKKGKAIEALVRQRLDDFVANFGISYNQGQVTLVGKEVDHAIPNLDDPYVVIMTSYMETTSSSQTARANEQTHMYLQLRQHAIRYGTERAFVNFVDGAGWLARRSDLRKLHTGCDYIINLKTLNALDAILCRYVPERFFTRQPRPQVIEG